MRVTTGFELKPAALINGTVLVGFRQMNVMAEGAPDYRGLVASVQAGFVAGRNKVTLTEQRDVAFSYDLSYPFFVQTSASGQLTRRLGRSWDVVGRAALHNLSYTQLVSSETDGVTDRVVQYGGGLGYIVGRAVPIGVNVDYFNRTTQNPGFTALRRAASRSVLLLRVGAMNRMKHLATITLALLLLPFTGLALAQTADYHDWLAGRANGHGVRGSRALGPLAVDGRHLHLPAVGPHQGRRPRHCGHSRPTSRSSCRTAT